MRKVIAVLVMALCLAFTGAMFAQDSQQKSRPIVRTCPAADYHNPRVMTKVDPAYTAKALRRKAQGAVTVRLFVNEQGIPQNITLYEGIDEDLNKKALEAVAKWRFFPATCKDEPMMAAATVKVNFALGQKVRVEEVQ